MGIRIDNQSLNTGAMTLVSQKTFAANAVDFTGLSGDYFYRVYLQVNSGGQGTIELNGDANAGHYHREFFYAVGAAVAGDAANENRAWNGAAGGLYGTIDVSIDGASYLRYFSLCSYVHGAGAMWCSVGGEKSDATAAEITQIKISATNPTTGTATLYKIAKV